MTYHEASLGQLADAYEGHLESEGLLPALPTVSRGFMDEMMRKHPDERI